MTDQMETELGYLERAPDVALDVFGLRDAVVAEYRRFLEGALSIRDSRVKAFVEAKLDEGVRWPEPWVSLNPSFAPGGWVDELAGRHLLDRACAEIFRPNDAPAKGRRGLRLYRHQVEAIEAARKGASYVLTTGTGSGKSLAYLIPIVDTILREGRGRDGRTEAIVVYPMNALVNSQLDEIGKFFDPEDGPVHVARYTGQESQERRDELRVHPPDVLLTNYVMLELLLTRTEERPLVEAASDLRFLVLDELHTYRGRQGGDVALLVRRLREATSARRLQCVGTSATLSSEGTPEDRRATVARAASRLFGSEVTPEHVIGERLARATSPFASSDPDLLGALREAVRSGGGPGSEDYEALRSGPLAAWIPVLHPKGVDKWWQ